MKSTRWQVGFFACLIALAVWAPSTGAQTDRSSRFVTVALGSSGHRTAHLERVALRDLRTPDTGLRTPDTGFRTPDYVYLRPIIRVGQDYTLRAGDTAHDVRSFFGNVTLEGTVDGEAMVVLGSVHAKSTAVVRDSLIVIGGSATIDQGATVDGDLVVVGGTLTAPPDFSPGGQHVVIGSPTLGNALAGVVPWITRGLLWGRLIVPDLGWVWVLVGIAFLVYLAVNTLFDRPVRTCADAIGSKPLSAFLLGLLVLVLTVPALAVLAATVVGVAVVPFVLCAMFLGALVGKAGVARALGRRLVAESSPESQMQALRSFLLGFVLIVVAYLVPLLGIVTWALTSVLAVGSAAMMLRATLRREHPPRERAAAARIAVPAPAVAPAVAAPGAPDESLQQEAPPPADTGAAPPPPPPPTGDLALFPRATFLDRVAAFALDCILVGIAVQVLDLGRHGGSFPLLLFVYHVAFWAWKGTTLGGIVVGLRVIPAHGAELRFVEALVRGLASLFSLAALGIGCFWMLQDPERQMWHDKIAGTVVVKVPRAVALA